MAKVSLTRRRPSSSLRSPTDRPDLLESAVTPRLSCDPVVHALAQRRHDADRWIAATAIHVAVPLVSHDGAFRGEPGLVLETMLVR